MKHELNFKRSSAQAIQSGAIRQSLFQCRKDRQRPVPGDLACCYTPHGLEGHRLIREVLIVEVRDVSIETDSRRIRIDGRRLGKRAARAFAVEAGFACIDDLLDYFQVRYGLKFEGICIAWDPNA